MKALLQTGGFKWDWDYTFEILPSMAEAVVVTIQLTALGFALALIIGLFLALARRSKNKLISWPAVSVVEFVRSTPLVVQLFFIFYVLPRIPIIGVALDPFVTAVLALGIHFGSYTSEVYRAGIEAVDNGQWNAARALNFSPMKTWTNIILPQAIPPMIPTLGNYLIGMFKETPQVSVVTVTELFRRADIFGKTEFRYLEPMTMVGVFFFLLSYPSALLVQRLEARYARRKQT